MPENKRNYLLLASLILIWGSSFLLTDRSLLFFSPEEVVTYRLTIGALSMLLISLIYSKSLFVSFRPWFHFAIYAVVGNILPYLLISTGQMSITSGMAGLLMAVMPLVTLVLAHFLLPNDKLNIFKLIGFVFGISGEQPAKAHELSSRQDVLSAMLGSDTLGFVISDATSLTKPITAQFSNLIGTEFSAINVQDDQIDFEQTNLYPPEATLYTFTTQVSSSVSYNGTVYAGFNINSPYGDFIYSVHEKNIGGKAVPGSVVTTGLSSVNRMKTDPDALLIRAL